MKRYIKAFLRILLTAAGIFLIANGAIVGLSSNFNIGVIAAELWGIFFAVCGIFFDKILAVSQKGAPRVIRWIVTAGVVAALGLCGFLAVFGQLDTADADKGITHIMVLGCAVHGDNPSIPLVLRLDAALEAADMLPEADIVVSGGQGPQEDLPEAQAMKKYLIEHGISEDRIITEEESESTDENFKYTKQILDQSGEPYRLAVVTNDFHMYRASRIAKTNGLDVLTYHADTMWYNAAVMYAREIMAVAYMWIRNML